MPPGKRCTEWLALSPQAMGTQGGGPQAITPDGSARHEFTRLPVKATGLTGKVDVAEVHVAGYHPRLFQNQPLPQQRPKAKSLLSNLGGLVMPWELPGESTVARCALLLCSVQTHGIFQRNRRVAGTLDLGVCCM